MSAGLTRFLCRDYFILLQRHSIETYRHVRINNLLAGDYSYTTKIRLYGAETLYNLIYQRLIGVPKGICLQYNPFIGSFFRNGGLKRRFTANSRPKRGAKGRQAFAASRLSLGLAAKTDTQH